MVIVIDSKEQARWRFSCPTVIRSLPTGDYSIEGQETSICIERKSLSDLVKTVIHDNLRFCKQLRRMAAMDVAAIVVEAPVTALFERQYPGDALPQSVRGKLNAIFLDFGVPTIWLDNRETAAAWVENLFDLYLGRK
jgi:ERCC4-type nuclease